MVPSSQTQIKMRPSREKVVCRIAVVHFGWANGMARICVGSGVSMSHMNNLPLWLPSAMKRHLGSNANRMNQISQSLNSKRCRIDAEESLCLAPVRLTSFKRPGFQHTIEFSHDLKWSIKYITVNRIAASQWQCCLKYTYLWHNEIPIPPNTVHCK